MAYRPPDFNLAVGLWRGLLLSGTLPSFTIPTVAPDAIIPGQLYLSPKAWEAQNIFSADGSFSSFVTSMTLRVPKFSDIRDVWNATGPDLVEIPLVSGRWYYVAQVDDQHKGFPNEYRFAFIGKMWVWPTPIP